MLLFAVNESSPCSDDIQETEIYNTLLGKKQWKLEPSLGASDPTLEIKVFSCDVAQSEIDLIMSDACSIQNPVFGEISECVMATLFRSLVY